MKVFSLCALVSLCTLTAATIYENGRERPTRFIDTKIASLGSNATAWSTYGPNATELSYKGRWDSQHISWWAAPGLKFAFTGENVAITFGPHTTNTVLVAYRVAGLDWQLSNITTNATHQFVSPSNPGLNATLPSQLPLTFELRVTNWAYGVQISAVHLAKNEKLIKVPEFSRRIEFIGDSLQSGYGATYEAFSGFGYTVGAGLGETEFSVTAYPGICLHDANCWGNPRGQTYQFFHTSDTSPRALALYNSTPPLYPFASQPTPTDLVIINIGTNDNNTANPVRGDSYYRSYLSFVPRVHETFPDAEIVLMGLWGNFVRQGNTWVQQAKFIDEVERVARELGEQGFPVSYFDTKGILQHGDIGPTFHPTDAGHIKVASHLMRYINIKFGWELKATGPEVQHETLYWNDQVNY
ncbi:Lipase, GDSL-like protein [Periconia macrospinosa]|uniref:Lipase, GDSL-like protein n=1 Tax=Periconia macrospinosa TaxID=97972 RepID=A0A2V1E963_9PLEO|nr:Lipase, GDSL-like protein [Periconia macrospinosa]